MLRDINWQKVIKYVTWDIWRRRLSHICSKCDQNISTINWGLKKKIYNNIARGKIDPSHRPGDWIYLYGNIAKHHWLCSQSYLVREECRERKKSMAFYHIPLRPPPHPPLVCGWLHNLICLATKPGISIWLHLTDVMSVTSITSSARLRLSVLGQNFTLWMCFWNSSCTYHFGFG